MTTLDRQTTLALLTQDAADELHAAEQAEAEAWADLDSPAYLRRGDLTLMRRVNAATWRRQQLDARLARERRECACFLTGEQDA